MSTRAVDLAIKYALSVTEKGLQQAVALTRDLATTSSTAQRAVDGSQKAIQAQYKALESIATRADRTVAKSAIDSSAIVNKALDDQILKLREAGSSYTAIMAQQKAMGASAAELAASIKRSSASEIASMQAVGAESARTVRQRVRDNAELRSAGRGATRAVLPFGGMGGNVLAGGIAAFASVEGIKSATEATVQRLNVAKQLQLAGLTSTESQTLAASTSALGLNPNAAAQSLKALAKQTTGALDLNHTGKVNQAAGHAFEALGIKQTDLAKTGGDLYKTLGLVADALQRGKGGAAEYAAASTLLGRGFASMNPLLRDGSKGLQEQAQWAEKYGLIAKGAGAGGLEALHKKQIELKFATMGLQQSIALNLTPALLKILPVVGDVAHAAGLALKPAIEAVSTVLGPVVKFFKSGSDEATVLKAGLVALGTAFGIYKVGMIATTVATKAFWAAQAALNIVLDANPIGIVVLALAGLTAGLIYAYDHSKTFRNALGDAFTWIKGAAADSINFVIDRLNDLISAWDWVQSKLGPLGSAQVGQISHVDFGSAASAPAVKVNIPNAPAVNAILNAPFPKGHAAGGIIAYAAGGLVPAMVSPGEMIVHGGMAATVPGARTAADSVFAMLPHGAAVITGSGQAMMGMGASLGDALAMQAPHFAAGGTVNALGWNVAAPKGSGGGRGPKATMRYVNHLPVGLMTTAQWQAYQAAHPKVSATGQGFSFSGPASTFGPPGEPAGGTAYGASSSQPGLALNPHGGGNWNDALARSLAGKSFRIEGAGHSAVLKVIDKGPSAIGSHGPRLIDITGAGVTAMGLNPSAFPTDSIFKATEIVGGVASAITKLTAAGTSPSAPTLSNLLPSLTGQTAFAGGYQAGLAGNTLSDTLKSGVLSSLIGDVAITKGGLVGGTQPTGTSSLSGAGAFTGRLGAMVAKAGEIAGHNYPYLWGGGHNSSFSAPYDCSGAVSAVLHAGGALKSPLVSGDLMHWGQPGKGKNVSIFSSPTHTFMQLAGRYFGTSGSNPGGGANWIAKFPENMPATTHPPGMRAGGIAGFRVGGRPKKKRQLFPHEVHAPGQGYWGHDHIWHPFFNTHDAILPGEGSPQPWGKHDERTGNPVPQQVRLGGIMDYAAGGIVGKVPGLTKRANPLSASLGLIGSLIGRDDSIDVGPIMGALAAQLDNVRAYTFQSLQALAVGLAKHSRKGLDPIQLRRLDTALNLVDAAIGNRIGLAVAGAQNVVDAIARGNAHKMAMATLAGVDPSSLGGLALTVALDKATVGGLNAQIGTLNQALATAKKYGDKATIKDVTDKLNAALGNLDNALVTSMNDWRAAVERAAQDAVDASSQSLSLAQGGQQILSLQQQLAGTDQTPGGGQQMAAYITSTIIPALQKQFAAQQADQAAAGSVGDAARVNQDILAEQQSQTAILQAQLDAQNAIKQTSAASANALKQAGGQLAFNFQGETMTDRLTGVGVGT